MAHPASTSGSSGTLLVVKMETQSSRWEPCSASPQHEVEQWRGPVEGVDERRRWPSSMETERECWRRGTSMSSKTLLVWPG